MNERVGEKGKTKIRLCECEPGLSVLLSVYGWKVEMAAMLCELFGLALASGHQCSSPGRRAREMVCGARVNLDLPARRLHTE